VYPLTWDSSNSISRWSTLTWNFVPTCWENSFSVKLAGIDRSPSTKSGWLSGRSISSTGETDSSDPVGVS